MRGSIKPWIGVYETEPAEVPFEGLLRQLIIAANKITEITNPRSVAIGVFLASLVSGDLLVSAATASLIILSTFFTIGTQPTISVKQSQPKFEAPPRRETYISRVSRTGSVASDTLSVTGSETPASILSPKSLSRVDSGYLSIASTSRSNSPPVSPFNDPSKTSTKSLETPPFQDKQLLELTVRKQIPLHALESHVSDPAQAVHIRRAALTSMISGSTNAPANLFAAVPTEHLNYASVRGKCAENVIGYTPLPLGLAGPLFVNGKETYIPMATTEGTLIASTSRGCKALNASLARGVTTVVVADGMTRAPVLQFSSITSAAATKAFIESHEGFELLQAAFQSTTRFGTLTSVTARMAGSYLYVRFVAATGDAMGMNMLGKGVEAALKALAASGYCDDEMKLISLSGNACADKKPAAVNWILGRGKSVIAEAVIPAGTVKSVLKTSVSALVALNTSKNYVGSALAGCSAGGFNAHAANIVAAVFLATGQDPAQVVESANCLTMMEETPLGDLRVSVTMPSIEVGTIGGGTDLAAQKGMLEMLGVKGVQGGAATLASIVAAGVVAAELSLCAALCSGDLVKAHMKFNRKVDK